MTFGTSWRAFVLGNLYSDKYDISSGPCENGSKKPFFSAALGGKFEDPEELSEEGGLCVRLVASSPLSCPSSWLSVARQLVPCALPLAPSRLKLSESKWERTASRSLTPRYPRDSEDGSREKVVCRTSVTEHERGGHVSRDCNTKVKW